MIAATAAAVALAVVLSALAAYVAVDRSLNASVDNELRAFARAAAVIRQLAGRQPPGKVSAVFQLPRQVFDTNRGVAILTSDGRLLRPPYDRTRFPISAQDLAVARGTGGAYFRDVQLLGAPVRIYAAPAGSRRAVIAEQGLSVLDHTLHQLALILAAIAVAGIVLAGVLAMLAVRVGAAPVHTLRKAADHVRSTGDLSRRIDTPGSDDLGRLGESFNAMLAALEESHRAQAQLVADASHELRTPIASLRTNLEVLLRAPDLDAEDRAKLLGDLVGQSAELGALVEDLLDSARDGDEESKPAALRLDELVAAEIERCTVEHPAIQVIATLQPCEITGHELRLRRAVTNLLDNAVKWSAPGGRVEVTLDAGVLNLRDHGPGFRNQDLPFVFDRFYRSPAARSVPGSGLGLAIVRKVAREHGGNAHAVNAPDGGAVMILELPNVRKTPTAPASGSETPV
jgi:two-component system sensor histidine kinase MprB